MIKLYTEHNALPNKKKLNLSELKEKLHNSSHIEIVVCKINGLS